VLLTSELDITELVEAFNDGNWLARNESLILNFIRISGIDLLSWSNNFTNSSIKIEFENSQIGFFMNGTSLSTNESDCSKKQLLHGKVATPSFFSVFSIVRFCYSNFYPSDAAISPCAFSNANMQLLDIWSLLDTVLVRNIWRFFPFQNSNETTIKSLILELDLTGYGYRLDTSIMHPLVFESTQTLWIYNSIGSIQADLFKYLKQINFVGIKLNSLKNFYYQIGIEWTTSLNLATQPWVLFSYFDWWDDQPEYTYPDSDFCLFAQYPQQINLTFILDSNNISQCTSTIRWLMANYFSLNMSTVLSSYPNSKSVFSLCGSAIDLKPMIDKCNLTDKNTVESQIYAEYYQIMFGIEFIQDLVIFIGIPCACLLSLALNLLIVFAVHRNREKDLKDDFYQYMSLNAGFNCAYCVIFLFYPVNSCIDTLTGGYFCSYIRVSVVAQLYKIVFQAYLGGAIKMCSNIFYILMNINRYMLIGREHNPILDKISQWNMNWVTSASVLISLLFNIGNIFEYKLNNNTYYVWKPKGDNTG
jgi:hypothetical protein